MYEVHGWLALAESTKEIDEGGLAEKVEMLRQVAAALDGSALSAQITLLNGRYTLVMNGYPNRRRSEALALRALIARVTELSPGAYGLVYERDEGVVLPNGTGLFSVSVVKRGLCCRVLAPFLSPTTPQIEDDDG